MGFFQMGHAQSPNRTPNEIVYEIRRLRATGKWTYEALALKFNLHPSTIGRHCRLVSHKDVAIPHFQKTQAEITQDSFESQRRVLTDLGVPLPEYLKTETELLAEGKTRQLEAEVEQLIQGPAQIYKCDSCGVAEGGEHLESCQDASGGTLVRS